MPRRSYTTDRSWERYQPYLPERLRIGPGREPAETWLGCDGVDVHLDRYRASAAAATVVVLHGGGGYSRLLSAVGVAACRAGYEAVVPDLPGFGLTAVPRRRFTYELWVQAVVDVVRAEREAAPERPVVLFGASMGGMLAAHAVAAGADAAAIAATTLIDPRQADVRRAVGRVPALGPLAARLLSTAPAITDPLPIPMALTANMRQIANDPDLARIVRRDRRGGGNVVPARFLRSWFTYCPAREVEELTLPVLLVHPAADRWTPAALSERTLARFAGPTHSVLLDNCGHFPVEEPGITVLERELGTFIAGVAGRPPARRPVALP
jgi:alpha-beta hydrolase superfamily lysophospholipase